MNILLFDVCQDFTKNLAKEKNMFSWDPPTRKKHFLGNPTHKEKHFLGIPPPTKKKHFLGIPSQEKTFLDFSKNIVFFSKKVGQL